MSATVLRGNALSLPLADQTVDLIVTSPPYFGLRSYTDAGEHYVGQIGDELTPAEFVDNLIAATREMARVLKQSGSIFVNLGDKYAGGRSGPQGKSGQRSDRAQAVTYGKNVRDIKTDIPSKSLTGIPWRYALRCIDDLGLILRAEIIWSKPNGLPESVTDRVRRSHETWFCFEQSGGVESASERFPFCPLCGRPVDARATLVARLKEADRGVEPSDLAHEVRPDDRVDGEDAARGDHDVAVVPGVPSVPVLEALDAETGVGAAHLVEDGLVAVVDADSQKRAALTSDERDRALSVDDASEPSDVCECVGHPLIIDDEPWIPQSLAAEIMQRVAEGEIDPQQAADFLSGDYVRNHSVWFHFTREPRYFSAVDEIREAHSSFAGFRGHAKEYGKAQRQDDGRNNIANADQSLGKLPGSVWTIPTEPLIVPDHLGVDHFAAFPTEWPRRIISGWSPRDVCTACGEGRRPVVASARCVDGIPRQDLGARKVGGYQTEPSGIGNWRVTTERALTGYACACPDTSAPTTPGVVLDPFGGTGTTALVASVLGRHGISVDMSGDYCRLATWRTTDPKQRAKAARRDYTPPAEQTEGQLELIEVTA